MRLLCLLILLTSSACFAGASTQKLRANTLHLSNGSGFVYTNGVHKYLITNWHVANSGSWKGRLFGSLEDGTQASGPIVRLDPKADLAAAIVDVPIEGLRLADALYVMQPIHSRGYPEGVLTESVGILLQPMQWFYVYPIAEVGTCFAGSRQIHDQQGRLMACRVLYTDNMTTLYSRPGSSGSPVVDDNGDLVGVMSSWDSGKDLGGMVSLEALRAFTGAL